MHGERMEITEKARLGKRERFGRLFAWIACQPGVTSEPFRTYARSTVNTDEHGRRRTSWGWLGRHYGRSRQSIMTHVKALREAGVPLAIRVFKGGLTKTFTSLRNKARQLSGKKESRKKALSHDRFSTAQQPKTLNGPLTNAEVESRRQQGSNATRNAHEAACARVRDCRLRCVRANCSPDYLVRVLSDCDGPP